MDSLIPGVPDDIGRECLLRIPYKSFPWAASVCKIWKDEVNSPAFHSLRKACGLTRSVLVLSQAVQTLGIGDGLDTKYGSDKKTYRLVLYEPDTGTWDTLPGIPFLAHGIPLFCKVAGVGTSLVVIGGWDPNSWAVSDEVFIFDFLSAMWHHGAPMPAPKRSFFACATDTDRTVFVAGGHDDEKNALRSALAYDVANDRWDPLPDMAVERDECKGLFRCGTFHVLSGYGTDLQGQFLKSSEAFDIAAGRWGPVEEGTLGTSMCPRNYEASDAGELYRCRAWHVEVMDGPTWREVAELPEDVRMASCVVAWRGKERLVLFGKARPGEPHAVYMLEVGGRGKGFERWSRVELPVEYTGHVLTGCFIQI